MPCTREPWNCGSAASNKARSMSLYCNAGLVLTGQGWLLSASFVYHGHIRRAVCARGCCAGVASAKLIYRAGGLDDLEAS